MTTGRLEAFSDGVLAIVITIMVLELRAPHGTDFAVLRPLLPVFLSYVLSFVFIAIYWNNHHHLLQVASEVDGRILWANLHLLFWLSLVPAVTAWMGENDFASLPVALYGVVLLCAACAYWLLSRALIARHGRASALARAVGRDLKGTASVALYVLAVGLAFVDSRLALATYVSVAVIWLVPDRRMERASKAVRMPLLVWGALAVWATAAAGGGGDFATRLVSRADGDEGFNSNCFDYTASVSATGRFVAFDSCADNLEPVHRDDYDNVFVRDTVIHETVLVSRSSGAAGEPGDSHSNFPSISGNGRVVAFSSAAAFDNCTSTPQNVFVRDLDLEATFLINRRTSDDPCEDSNGDAAAPSVSADGHSVAYHSLATNLHPDDDDTIPDVFLTSWTGAPPITLETETVLVSRASGVGGSKANAASTDPSVSGDGRFVAFASTATNLFPGTGGWRQVYVRDLDTSETILVSRDGVDGDPGSGDSGFPSISFDGRWVAFESAATNLHPDDSDTNLDVYARDLATGVTRLASRVSGATGEKANADTFAASISSSGPRVAFVSIATNLDPDDSDATPDVYVRDLATNTTALASRASGQTGAKGNAESLLPALAPLGRYVAFTSRATNLDPDDMEVFPDIFQRDLLGQSVFADGFESGDATAWSSVVP